jgi:iron complex outermembrane recepter protein
MRSALLNSAAWAVTIACSGAACAQDTSPTAASSTGATRVDSLTTDATSEASGQLVDIVVTAQRRSENLQRAAVPVDVVSASDVLNRGITNPDALGTLVPALTVTPAGGARSNFFLRGVGSFTSNPIFDSAIAFNFDNVYVGRPGSTSGLFYDLERIEVLKGPQGTLYGRNATGGAINVIPARPKAGEFSGYLTGSYGNYDAINVEGAVNVPMGENGALRASGTLIDRSGYLSDGTSDEKIGAFRVQMLGELSPELTIRTSFDYAQQRGRGSGASYENAYFFNPATNQYVIRDSGLDRSVGLYDPRAQAFRRTLRAGPSGRNFSDLAPPTFVDNNFYGAHAEIAYNTGAGVLTIIPAWRYSDQVNLSNSIGFTALIREKDEQYSIEARFAGNRIGIFDYTLGGLYFHEKNNGHFAIGQQAISIFQNVLQTTTSAAAFARVTAHLHDTLRLVGGIRYTDDRKRFTGDADRFVVACQAPACPTTPLLPQVTSPDQYPFPIPPRPTTPAPGVIPFIGTGAILIRTPSTFVNASLPKNRITYRAAVEFDVAERSLLYASVETGFRSGGFSLATGYETFEPEYLTAWTVGSKNRLFDNLLQLNVEGFYWQYRDQQLATIGIDQAGQQGNFTQNIGQSKIYGFDVESRFLVTPTTVINAQVQYLKTKYQKFLYQLPVGQFPPFVGCPVAVNPANPAFYNVDCSGKPAYNAPKWTVNLGAEKTIKLGNYKLIASADTQYRSSRFVGFEYLPGQLVGSTWTSNAQLSFAPIGDSWTIAAFIRNIENNRFAVTANTCSICSALIYLTNPPQTYGVRGSVKF